MGRGLVAGKVQPELVTMGRSFEMQLQYILLHLPADLAYLYLDEMFLAIIN